MINTIFLGINILLLIVIWEKVLKPSILDNYRDKLFDLREEVREYYLAKGIPLSHNTYIQLRNLINSHLRFTEQMSFIKVSFFPSRIEKNRDLKNYIQRSIESNFATNNKDLSLFIKSTRKKAVDILRNYMIFSSPTLIISLILAIIIFIPSFIMETLTLKIRTGLKHISEKVMKNTPKIAIKFISTVFMIKLGTEDSTEDFLEKLSYETDLPKKTMEAA